MATIKIVKKIILGSAQFGEKYGIKNFKNKTSRKTSLEILKLARRLGIETVDLANSYKTYREIFNYFNLSNWKISMKISIKKLEKNLTKEEFENFFFQTLNYLKKNKIEYFLFHDVNEMKKSKGRKVFNYLKDLKKRGYIKKIGVSLYSPNEFFEILKIFKIDVVQFPINILDQRFCDDKILKAIKKYKIEVHARSIFLQGLLLSKKNEIKKKYFKKNYYLNHWFNYLNLFKKNPLAECVNFVLKKKFVHKIVLGVNTVNHLKSILKVIDIKSNIEGLDMFKAHDKKLIDPRIWEKIK